MVRAVYWVSGFIIGGMFLLQLDLMQVQTACDTGKPVRFTKTSFIVCERDLK